MRVLFIGNSHTFFNDMPALFARFMERDGIKTEVTMLAYPGRYLDWHMKEYFATRFNILYGHYDYCVIQQGAHPFPEEENTLANGHRIIDMCRTVNTTPVVTMTWAEKRAPEHQEKMIRTFTKLCDETGALLNPVGLVWQKMLKDHPEIDLFWKDGEHASVYGDYLIAATLYAVVTGHHTVQLPAIGIDFLGGQDTLGENFRLPENPELVKRDLDPKMTAAICAEITSVLSA